MPAPDGTRRSPGCQRRRRCGCKLTGAVLSHRAPTPRLRGARWLLTSLSPRASSSSGWGSTATASMRWPAQTRATSSSVASSRPDAARLGGIRAGQGAQSHRRRCSCAGATSARRSTSSSNRCTTAAAFASVNVAVRQSERLCATALVLLHAPEDDGHPPRAHRCPDIEGPERAVRLGPPGLVAPGAEYRVVGDRPVGRG